MQNDTEKQESKAVSDEEQILALMDTIENLNSLIDRLDREARVLEIMRSAVLDELDAISAKPGTAQIVQPQKIEYPV